MCVHGLDVALLNRTLTQGHGESFCPQDGTSHQRGLSHTSAVWFLWGPSSSLCSSSASCSLSSFPLTLPCFNPSLYLLGYFLSLPQYSLKTGTTSPFSLLTSIVQAWYFLNKDSVHFYKVKQNIMMTTICGAMCARQATKCFTYFILFNPYSNPVMWCLWSCFMEEQ